MKTDDLPHLARELEVQTQTITPEAEHVRATNSRPHKSVRKWQRSKIEYRSEVLRSMSEDQKVQHNRDSVCDAIMQAAIEAGRGQPPRVERLRAAANIVDELESKNGIPFRIGRNSRMNKELCIRLNEEARQSKDSRKSWSKQIKPDAARELLRQVRRLRESSRIFTKMFPYTE